MPEQAPKSLIHPASKNKTKQKKLCVVLEGLRFFGFLKQCVMTDLYLCGTRFALNLEMSLHFSPWLVLRVCATATNSLTENLSCNFAVKEKKL